MIKCRKLVCLNNIPTPYRLFFFKLLNDELKRRGWDFEAWFMAQSEPGRFWKFEPADFQFKHQFFWGCSPRVANVSFHFNPGVIPELVVSPPDILIAGGAWCMPSAILSSFARHKTFKVFWSESHFLSVGRSDKLTNSMRSRLMGRYDAFAVPGRLAREYVEQIAPGKRILALPNLVDAAAYGPTVRRLREHRPALRQKFAIPDTKRVLLISARLNPAKAILPFLDALTTLSEQLLERFVVAIAGEGELRPEIENWIARNPSPQVILLGQQTQAQMCGLYALSDGFALPSYSDPNPLSAIEALWGALPLLLSDRVGNHPETLVSNRNGWLFSTDDDSSICRAVATWVGLSDEELLSFGQFSYGVASRSFDPDQVVAGLVDDLIALSRRKQ